MIDKKFGRLLVLEDVGRSKDRLILYKCKCDCGNEVIVKSKHLRSGETQSCGCLAKEKRRKALNTVSIGEKYGKLTVISYKGSSGKGASLWLCRCDCGNEIIQSTNHLTSGNTKSCGCLLKKDLTGKRFGKLLVIKFSKSKDQNRMWLCKCDCGNEIEVSTADLNRKYILSCGCSDKYSLDCIKTRRYDEYAMWRKQVFKRDDYMCKICGANGKLNAHHIVNYKYSKPHSYDINNGITMCKKCHKLFHHTYGIKNNTIDQFEEFLKNIRRKNK
jgi:hypothetical protein